MASTDERLDDRFNGMDRRFDRVDAELLDLRREMRDGFAGVRGEIAELRVTVLRIGGAMMVSVLGVIAAVVATVR